jgi:hypothetical protein
MAVCPPHNMVVRLLRNMAVCPLHSMAAYLLRNMEVCPLHSMAVSQHLNTEVCPLPNMAVSQHLNMVAYRVLKAVECQLLHLTFMRATFRPGLCFFENLRREVISRRQD